MKRPVVPSTWKATDGNVRDDLRRLRVYLDQLEDYIDANSGGSSFTQAQADLLYLKRAANDFSSFPAKASPTGADLVLFEDAAASFAKKYATLAQLGFAANYTTGAVPLWVPPSARGATAGALDDEFDSTTINPAWVFRDLTTGPTNRTPSFGALTENTDLTGATTVPNVSLHTQGRRSHMLVQTTITGPAIYWIYKPFTWVANHFYWTRLGYITELVGQTGGNAQFVLWASSGGLPDLNNRAHLFLDIPNHTVRWQVVVAGVTSNITADYNAEGYGILHGYLGIGNPAGVLGGSASWYGELFTDDGMRRLASRIGVDSFSFTPAFIGWQISNVANKPQVISIDFVRETVGHPLFHI